jgi:hypothetical protein
MKWQQLYRCGWRLLLGNKERGTLSQTKRHSIQFNAIGAEKQKTFFLLMKEHDAKRSYSQTHFRVFCL